jgi:hypothetical protein
MLKEEDLYLKVQSGTLKEVIYTKFYDHFFFFSLKSLDKNSFLMVTSNCTSHIYHDGKEWLYSYKDTYLFAQPKYLKIDSDLYSFVLKKRHEL